MKRFLLCALLLGVTLPSFAEVPQLMSYSGKLVTKGGKIITDGDYDMRFSLYTVPAGGSPVWSEFHEGTTYAVPVTAGAFQTVLGSVQPTSNPLPAFNANYYLEVRAFIKGSWEIFGRQPMLSVPYALWAAGANAVANNTITSEKITDGGIGSVDIKDGSILSADIANGAITSNHAPWAPTVNNGISNPKIFFGFGTSNSEGLYTLTFSTPFSARPTVLTTTRAGDVPHRVTVSNITNTGCQIRTYSAYSDLVTDGPVGFEWVAIGN